MPHRTRWRSGRTQKTRRWNTRVCRDNKRISGYLSCIACPAYRDGILLLPWYFSKNRAQYTIPRVIIAHTNHHLFSNRNLKCLTHFDDCRATGYWTQLHTAVLYHSPILSNPHPAFNNDRVSDTITKTPLQATAAVFPSQMIYHNSNTFKSQLQTIMILRVTSNMGNIQIYYPKKGFGP